MGSLRSFLDAAGTFVEHVSDVHVGWLAAALVLHVANLLLRSRAWTSILRAAFPGEPVRWPVILGAYTAGVGINAFAPARGGDVVKIATVRQKVEGSNVPALTSSLVAETLFDFVIATSLLVWAYAVGALPTLPEIPSAPAFEWSFLARHTDAAIFVVIAGSLALVLLVRWLAGHVRAFWQRVEQGVAILARPLVYLRTVALLQALGWCCRLGTAYAMLEAFRVGASLHDALLVLVVGSLATLLPVTPGGAGPQQALLVIVLAGSASPSALIAYSVGAQVAITALNVLLGAASLFLLFGSVRFRHIRHEPA